MYGKRKEVIYGSYAGRCNADGRDLCAARCCVELEAAEAKESDRQRNPRGSSSIGGDSLLYAILYTDSSKL